MIASKELIKRVFALITAQGQRAGWRKRERGIFSVDVSYEVFGSVSLNTAIGRGQGVYEVNPIVGVNSHQLERLVHALIGATFKSGTTVAICSNIGYLMPENKYKAWLFHEDLDCEALAADLVATVEEFGLPYMRAHATLGNLYITLRRTSRRPWGMQLYNIPVGCVLLGRFDEAEAFLDKTLTEAGTRTDLASQQFKGFAAKLRAYIAESQTG